MSLPAKVEMDLFSLGLIIGCFLDENSHPKLSPRCHRDLDLLSQTATAALTVETLFPNNSHLDTMRCDRLPFLRPAVCQLCSSRPCDRGNLQQFLKDLNSQSRTRLQSRLIEERDWWKSNSEHMKSLFERSLESQSSVISSTVESTLNQLFESLSTNMANQSQDLCDGIEEVLACVRGAASEEELWMKMMEVKRRLDAI
jgi:uncharacterized protein (DUF2342 family)